MNEQRSLTPSNIAAWLACEHYLTLTNKVDAGELQAAGNFGEMAQLLVHKGLEHEEACLQAYQQSGKIVHRVDGRREGEAFSEWVERIGDEPFRSEPDVIFQMPFIHDGIRGIADFLIKVEAPTCEGVAYEPLDAKLTRHEAKPSHILQLCFYAEAIAAMTGYAGDHIHIWLGSGEIETHQTNDFLHYWRRLRARLQASMLDEHASTNTKPVPCSHCNFCEFEQICKTEWRATDSLVNVAGLRSNERELLEANGIETIAKLAECHVDLAIPDLSAERLERISKQAHLQKARADEDTQPPFALIAPGEDKVWGRGFEQLPKPNDGDVFLDYEGHPFWTPKNGLFFLFGFIARDKGGWQFNSFWAHDKLEERDATLKLIDYICERRQQFPDMHVYHYNHTERSSLERLVVEHNLDDRALNQLADEGAFVDLFKITRNAVQVGTESYGLKHLERLAGFARDNEIEAGAGAVIEYDLFMVDQDPARLERIAKYNEDDVRAAMMLRDWLVGERSTTTPWREPVLSVDIPEETRTELVTDLLDCEPDSPEHLLGNLLEYWNRERRAVVGPMVAMLSTDTDAALKSGEAIDKLTFKGFASRQGKIETAAVFTFPPQEVSPDFGKMRSSVLFIDPDGPPLYAGVDSLKVEARELKLLWNEKSQEAGVIPQSVALDDWVSPRPKPAALESLAQRVWKPDVHGAPERLPQAILGREKPCFTPGNGPADGHFTPDLESMLSWICHLDGSYVPIQGPPGTGKTYTGARLVKKLISSGKRVGICAMSHAAIDNLFDEVLDLSNREGWAHKIDGVRVGKTSNSTGVGVRQKGTVRHCAAGGVNLVAGTTWLFANAQMIDNPVDVLIIDEAGQLSLADAIAASASAKNMILLGDPLQLPQVAKAAHFGRSGLSVLEHILGDDRTIPPDRGVFLEETRRMHPDVCGFISEVIYEGRVRTHDLCSEQGTDAGTGLRWLEVEHNGCTTASEVEADLVVNEIRKLLGRPRWFTDQDGKRRDAIIDAEDVMVVAPYNDQVNLLRAKLNRSPDTEDVRVGTVDKFQGQEAPVVFYTMTSSNTENIKRGQEFLFSRARLNVAISRAKCLAFLVCTKEILDAKAVDVEGMRRISSLAAFVDYRS